MRQLIVDSVEPVFGDSYYYDNSLVSNLNDGQKEAIQKVLIFTSLFTNIIMMSFDVIQVMSSKDYTMILGMPGTGRVVPHVNTSKTKPLFICRENSDHCCACTGAGIQWQQCITG